jgi:protein TonB
VVDAPDIKAPREIRRVKPNYPQIAQLAQVEGVVLLRATVGPDGRVSGVEVVRSIDSTRATAAVRRLLDNEATKAARQFEYEPGRRNGVAVSSQVEIPITFKLKTDR